MTKQVNLKPLLYEALYKAVDLGFGILGGVAPSPTELKLQYKFEEFHFAVGYALKALQTIRFKTGQAFSLCNEPLVVQQHWLKNKILPPISLELHELLTVKAVLKTIVLNDFMNTLPKNIKNKYSLDSKQPFLTEDVDFDPEYLDMIILFPVEDLVFDELAEQLRFEDFFEEEDYEDFFEEEDYKDFFEEEDYEDLFEEEDYEDFFEEEEDD